MASGHGAESGRGLQPGVGGPLSAGGSGRGMGSTGVLHVSVLPVLAKGAVAFVRGRGAQAVSEAGGPHRGGLVGEPGSERPGSAEGSPPLPAAAAAAARRPYLGAGAASGERQQLEPRQKPPRMASREALQPR